MLIQEFLENSAKRVPDKTALVAGSVRMTYQELDARANSLAGALSKSGVEYGDRIVILLDNSTEAVISIFGALKAGGAFVPINPTMKAEKLNFILNNCRATALIAQSSKLEIVREATSDAPHLKTVILVGEATDKHGFRNDLNTMRWNDLAKRDQTSHPPQKTIDIDLAALIYTSGTTGNPKGVMLTHQNMVSASTSITTYLENEDSDIILNVLPLSFDYGLYQVLMAFQFGGTVILEKTFLYPYAIINLLKKEKVTGFPIVPTISAILLQLKKLEDEKFEHLRYITNTAAALPVSHIKGLQKIFKGTKIYSMYGLTECKRVSYLPPEELDQRPESVGKGMPNEQVYLVDENDEEITGPNIVGELVVRGANVMKGYWELPEETEQMLRTGKHPREKVLYTGDLFYKDEEGFLYFVSRKDDIIKSRGEKISPKEIENTLYELPDVLEAAVVGIPDDLLGQAIKAYIVLKNESKLTEEDILSHCTSHLEDFMVPKIVEFKDSLPKTDSGKITKKGL